MIVWCWLHVFCLFHRLHIANKEFINSTFKCVLVCHEMFSTLHIVWSAESITIWSPNSSHIKDHHKRRLLLEKEKITAKHTSRSARYFPNCDMKSISNNKGIYVNSKIFQMTDLLVYDLGALSASMSFEWQNMTMWTT